MEKLTKIKDIKKIRRAPIVAIMGHVDHGKTSILDVIRNTNVQIKEFGGITQHIGAYQVEYKSQKITFIDTPGHAAFSRMRARGGKAADIVVLVVAANDSVMPQTKEAISHARAAGATLIVAINKIDLADADINKVKQDLSNEGVLVEDWGGDILSVPVSALQKTGISELLETILVVSELLNLESDPEGELEAIVIEARVDRKKGPLVSCIIKNGRLSVGQEAAASGIPGKIKSIVNYKGESVKSISLGEPGEILGFKHLPTIGDLILQKGSELAEISVEENKIEIIGKDAKEMIAVVLKTDTQGTLEAVKASLAELIASSVGSSVAIKFLHSSTGDISESDVMLAHNSKGMVLGFNVRVNSSVEDLSKTHNVPVKVFKTIYELLDNARDVLEGTAVNEEAKIRGRAKVLKTFKLPSGDIIAGCKVLAGTLKDNSRVFIYDKDPSEISEDYEPLYKGEIKTLKKLKDKVKTAGKDTECGVLLKPTFEDIKEGNWIEVK